MVYLSPQVPLQRGFALHAPSAPDIAQLMEKVATELGVNTIVALVKNYTGDVLNFELAAELTADSGIECTLIRVQDDSATRGVSRRSRNCRGPCCMRKSWALQPGWGKPVKNSSLKPIKSANPLSATALPSVLLQMSAEFPFTRSPQGRPSWSGNSWREGSRSPRLFTAPRSDLNTASDEVFLNLSLK